MIATTLARPIVLVLLAAGSCAQLEIQVDVYKGPLANEQRVQIQQLSVMAIGAKPLLIQARDWLECAGRNWRLEKLWSQPWYQDRWWPEPVRGPVGAPEYEYFMYPKARTLQAVLALYEDLPEDHFGHLVRLALDTYEDYRKAARVLEPSEADRARFAEWKAKAKPDVFELTGALEPFLAPEKPDDETEPWRRDPDKLIAYLDKIEPLDFRGVDVDPRRSPPANVAFRLIEDKRNSARLARRWLADASDQREFGEYLREVAGSFNRARAGLERLLLLALEYIRDSALDETDRRETRLRTATTVVKNLVSTYYLNAALSEETGAKAARSYLKQLLGSALKAVDDAYKSKGKLDTNVAVQGFRSTLARGLREDPIWMSTALLAVHEDFKREFAPTGNRTRLQSLSDATPFGKMRRGYGLVPGPSGALASDESRDAVALAEVHDLLEPLESGGTQGLGDGRYHLGLDTLITSYIDSVYHADEATEKQERKRLVKALIRFAEKLRVISTLNDLGLRPDAGVRPYVDTLSAISNSILAAAHAIFSSERYLEHQEQAEATEVAARAAAAGAKNWPDAKTAKGALDAVIACLRHERIDAAKKGEDLRLQRVDKALQMALAQRSGMVQLRPAADYLRTSYLTSAHQAGTESTKTARSVKDIDRQFWQRINTVRLSGTGETQYTLVKDDVGNWYVKGFSADPRDIIKAGKSLAMYAAAGTVSPVALAQAQTLLGQVGTTLFQPEDPDSHGSAIKVLLDREDERAAKQLAAEVRQLDEQLEGLDTKIEAEWADTVTGSENDRKAKLAVLRLVLREHHVPRIEDPDKASAADLRSKLLELRDHGKLLVKTLGDTRFDQFIKDKSARFKELGDNADDDSKAAFKKDGEPVADPKPHLKQLRRDVADVIKDTGNTVIAGRQAELRTRLTRLDTLRPSPAKKD